MPRKRTPKIGRPQKFDRKILFCATDTLYNNIGKAAALRGQTRSAWMRDRLAGCAKQALKDHRRRLRALQREQTHVAQESPPAPEQTPPGAAPEPPSPPATEPAPLAVDSEVAMAYAPSVRGTIRQRKGDQFLVQWQDGVSQWHEASELQPA